MNNFIKKAEELKPALSTKVYTISDSRLLTMGESVIFDFGTHLVGTPEISVSYKGRIPDSPVYLRIYFAESERELEENCETYNGWISKGWIQEEFIHVDEIPSVVSFSRRYAFRYVRISVLAFTKDSILEIQNVKAYSVTSAPEEIGLCGRTEEERKIDAVALKTLSDCMQTEFEDGPKRDRRLWLGDLRLQALTNYETYKHNDLVKRCLYLFAGCTLPDGRVCQSIFTRPVVQGDGGSNFDYSLLFVPTLLDYYQATGDAETARELLPTAKKQIELAREYFKEDVMGDYEMGWCFLDWSFELNRQTGGQAVYIYSEKALIRLLRLLKEDASEYEEDAARKEKTLIEHFFDDELKLFVSGQERQISYASNVWSVLAGVFSKEENAHILHNLQNYKDAIKPVTPYMMHHYVQALIESALLEEGEAVMKDYWGGMVALGADTFWELYNPDDPDETPYGGIVVNSYCHAWSCTPSYFLRKYFRK